MRRARSPRPTRTIAALGAVVMTSAFVLTACGSSDSNDSGTDAAPTSGGSPDGTTLHLSFLQDPGQPPDPDIFYAGQGLTLTTNLYEGLLRYKTGTATPELEPALAESYTASPDNKTFTFKLRQGVTFHDGTPFTSAAVKVSFDRRIAVNQGPAYMATDAKITTQGDYGVTITLPRPNSAFLTYMGSAYGPKMISPTGLAANAGSDHGQKYLTTHDLGTGAYTLTKAEVGAAYELKSYLGYWGAKPYFTTVELPVITDPSSQQLQFNSGDLAAILHDIPSSAVKSYLDNKKVSSYNLPAQISQMMYVNPDRGFLKTTEGRVALSKAVDIDAIVKQAYFGRGTKAKQIYPVNVMDEKYAVQDITTDTTPLKDLVGTLSGSDKNLVIGYDSSAPDAQIVSNLLQTQLAPLGLSVKVQSFPTSQVFGWIGDKTGSPDIYVGTGWPDSPSPYTWGHISWDPGAGLNYLSCSDPATTQLLQKGLVSGADSDWSDAAESALKTGCWLNLVDVTDFMVAQPWLKGVENAHTVSNPNSLYLANLSA